MDKGLINVNQKLMLIKRFMAVLLFVCSVMVALGGVAYIVDYINGCKEVLKNPMSGFIVLFMFIFFIILVIIEGVLLIPIAISVLNIKIHNKAVKNMRALIEEENAENVEKTRVTATKISLCGLFEFLVILFLFVILAVVLRHMDIIMPVWGYGILAVIVVFYGIFAVYIMKYQKAVKNYQAKQL